jgi:DNA-directed RNA polymerase subunit F
MIGRKILDSRNATLGEVSKILGEIPEAELGFEQMKSLEYTKTVSKLSHDKAHKLIEELMSAVEKLDNTKATKIADILPITEAEVRSFFAKEIYSLTEDEVNKIIEVVKKYVK